MQDSQLTVWRLQAKLDRPKAEMQRIAERLKASRDFSDDPVPGQGTSVGKAGLRGPFRPAGGAASLFHGAAKQSSALAQSARHSMKAKGPVAERSVAISVLFPNTAS